LRIMWDVAAAMKIIRGRLVVDTVTKRKTKLGYNQLLTDFSPPTLSHRAHNTVDAKFATCTRGHK
jgi:hypothetical protein